MKKNTAKGLGRGLEALFDDNRYSAFADESGENVQVLAISSIEPNAAQPRKTFDADALSELAASIQEHGVISPIIVRPTSDGQYQIVTGERRWRASRMAGLKEIPAIAREIDDREAAQIALIENLQRQDLNPMEEANGYRALIDEFNLTQEEVARRVGKSRPTVANALRLLTLPPDVSKLVEGGQISAGHARVLAGMSDGADALARKIVEQDLSVRETEKYARETSGKRSVQPARKSARSTQIAELELSISERIGRRIHIKDGRKKGRIEIEYYGYDDLDALIERLTR